MSEKQPRGREIKKETPEEAFKRVAVMIGEQNIGWGSAVEVSYKNGGTISGLYYPVGVNNPNADQLKREGFYLGRPEHGVEVLIGLPHLYKRTYIRYIDVGLIEKYTPRSSGGDSENPEEENQLAA